LASRIDVPASSGDEMRSFEIGILNEWFLDINEVDGSGAVRRLQGVFEIVLILETWRIC